MSSPVSMKSRALLVLLAALAALAATRSALAQPFLCTTIRPGEGAAQVAQRITGQATSTRESWFQIVDPATSRFVPKARYDYVRAGWHACVATGLNTTAMPPVRSSVQASARHVRAAYDDIIRLSQFSDSNLALWVVLLALIALATHGADDYFKDRQQVLKAMRLFSQKFISEFERPLVVDAVAPRPIQSCLRFAPHASRVDILIAPGAGHRYPNLTDHRSNVEYDVNRVLSVLRDEPFSTGRPYMDGPWVVLPFQLNSAITQAGGK